MLIDSFTSNNDSSKEGMPYIIIDNYHKVISASSSFNSEITKVSPGDDLLKLALVNYNQAQWKDCVYNFLTKSCPLEIKHVLFIPKSTVIDDKIIPIIQYWYLQTIEFGGNKIIVFHNTRLDSSLDHIITNFVDYAKDFNNEVEFLFHRKAKSTNRHTYINPFTYGFIMPFLAKSNFHIAQGKLYRDYFNIDADLRVGNMVQKELDSMSWSDKSADIRKFREKYLNKNFIPFAQITFPMILTI